MKLYTIENKEEEKLLRTKLAPFDFTKYTKKELDTLIKEMRKTMHHENGVGLAANQVGLNTQVFVAATEGKFYALFNPKIEKTMGKLLLLDEGCLSVPQKSGTMKRYEKVIVSAQDKTGKPIKIKAWGLLAQIFQHETDHLAGKLYIDNATNVFDITKPEEN